MSENQVQNQTSDSAPQIDADADAEAKEKADAEAKAKADAEAKEKADAEAKAKESAVAVGPRHVGKAKVKAQKSYQQMKEEKMLKDLRLWSHEILENQIKSERTSQVLKDACKKELAARKAAREESLKEAAAEAKAKK